MDPAARKDIRSELIKGGLIIVLGCAGVIGFYTVVRMGTQPLSKNQSAYLGSLSAGKPIAVNQPHSSSRLPYQAQDLSYFASVPHFSSPEDGIALVSGDFNQDGDLEAIVGTIHEGKNVELYFVDTSSLNLYDPDTRLSNTLAPTKKIVELPYSSDQGIKGSLALTAGDFDRDEDLDLIVARVQRNSTELYLFYNDGDGNFTPYSPPEQMN